MLAPLGTTLLALGVAAVSLSGPSRDRPFTLTAEHVRLLRQATVLWTSVESGAPAVLVTPLLLGGASEEEIASDVAVRAGIAAPGKATAAERARATTLLEEMPEALAQLLVHGKLEPGTYTFASRVADVAQGAALLPPSIARFGKERTATFTYTAEHAALLAHAQWQGMWVDPKRPYGDMSYFELDMADILGIPTSANERGEGQIPPEVEKRLGILHEETLPALQLFLEKADVAPGAYPRIAVSPGLDGH